MATAISSPFRPRAIYEILLEDKKKFVLIVSREDLNRGNGCTTVMFITKNLVIRAKLLNRVYFKGGQFGLKQDCVAQFETIAYTYYDEFVNTEFPIGYIDDKHWNEVVSALGYVMEATCFP